MPVPVVITDLSQVAASNFPAGSDTPGALDDSQRAHGGFIALIRDGKGLSAPVTLASAATTDIGAQNSIAVEISGTTTITSFGTTYNGPRFLRFTGALILTHSASLSLPGASNITTVAGDTAIAYPNSASSGWNVIAFNRAAGAATAGANNDITSMTALAAGGLPDNSVLTADIANAAITAAKLSGAQTGTAPIYGIRAWGNFDGTLAGTNAPTAGGNVTNVQRTAVGTYTVTMTTAMADVNYSVVLGVTNSGWVTRVTQIGKTTTTFELTTFNSASAVVDYAGVAFSVIR